MTSEPGVDFSKGAKDVRKATHSFLRDFPASIEGFKFNVGVAKLMELVNALRKAIDSGVGPADPAVREGAEEAAKALSLYAPYTAEDMWHSLGHQPGVALAGFSQTQADLLVESSTVAVVQVDGKVRDKLEVAIDISADELRGMALASDVIKRQLEGKTIANVIVREPKLVSIATK